MSPTSFQNKTVFFVPAWTDEYHDFISALKTDARYEVGKKENAPEYLLPYITKIYDKEKLFFEAELKNEFLPKLDIFAKKPIKSGRAHLDKLRISCFGTGCIFIELEVVYQGAIIDDICNFAFIFKCARFHIDKDSATNTLLETIDLLMPQMHKKPTVFFTSKSDMKKECKMFHQIRSEQPISTDELNKYLAHLRRGYNNNFSTSNIGEEHDMSFSPYAYDHWSGSQEGFANIFWVEKGAEKFINDYKPIHLDHYYRFMYLVLLNQRYAAIKCLEKIPVVGNSSKKESLELSKQISDLKTIYSFSVVSDDQLYQNIYTKMYSILDIDRLLSDIQDNEERMEILQKHDMLSAEKRTNRLIFGLSILSLFSVLIDSASYFDRFAKFQAFSNVISFAIPCAFVIWCILWHIYDKKK
jgi:uncharacterized membrane protein (DUF485 family)